MLLLILLALLTLLGLVCIAAILFGSAGQAPRRDAERAKLLRKAGILESKLKAVKTRLYSRRPPQDNDDHEIKALSFWSWALWVFLLVSVLSATFWVWVDLQWWDKGSLFEYFSLASAAGLLGAGLSGLLSLNNRVANGWEFADGAREPDPAEMKERFNLRMLGGFFARPFLGLASGPLVMAGFRLGELAKPASTKTLTTEQAQALAQVLTQALAQKQPPAYAQSLAQVLAEGLAEPIDQQYHVFFFCFLGGLASKTLFDWLRNAFRKLLV